MHQSLATILLALASRLYVGYATSPSNYWEAESRMRNDSAYANSLATFNSRTLSSDTPMPDAVLCRQHHANLNKVDAATGNLAERSLSPWRYIKNFDSRRSQDDLFIVDTACACLGCFVPKEGEPEKFVYTESLISVPIAFERNVKMAGGETVNVTTHMGCQCQFPRYTTNAGDQPIVESAIL